MIFTFGAIFLNEARILSCLCLTMPRRFLGFLSINRLFHSIQLWISFIPILNFYDLKSLRPLRLHPCSSYDGCCLDNPSCLLNRCAHTFSEEKG